MNKQNQSNKKTAWITPLIAIVVLVLALVIFNGNVKVKGTNGGICGTSNYKVTLSFVPPISPPSVSCNDTETWVYCIGRDRYPTLLWTYSDPENNPQSAYQIQADNNSDFSSPEENPGWLSSATTEYPTRGNFSWDTTYYWQIRVKNSGGAESGWSSSCSFKTPLHAYPSPDFSKYPDVPVAGEPVQFVDNTDYGGSYGKAWSWTFTDGNPTTSTQPAPKVTFSSLGTKAVGLIVTDSDGYSCPCSKSVGIGLPSPKWREIKPW
jgi:hypothetical protein